MRRRIRALLEDDIVTYPWDQTLRGQLTLWLGIAKAMERSQDEHAREGLLAELQTQIQVWLRSVRRNPWQWDYHGGDVEEIERYFDTAYANTRSGDMKGAKAAVERAYKLVGVTA